MPEKIIAFLQKEWGNLLKAPWAFVTLAILCLGLGFSGAVFYYGGQIASLHEQLNTKDGELGRYRVALGIDPASKGALIELNNQELQAKALATASKLRDMCFSLQRKNKDLEAVFAAGKINDQAKWERHLAINKEMSEQFARTLRADAFNVDNELRRRLGPQAVAAIVGITPSLVADDGTRIDITTILPGGSGFDVEFTCTLADGVEQMAKLLPPDSRQP